MEWWEAAIEWLNANSGAVSAVATVGTVLFTAVAASAAWITIRMSRRRKRSNLQLTFRPNTIRVGLEMTPRQVISMSLMNSGPSTPIWIEIRMTDGHGWGSVGFDPPKPRELIHPLEDLGRPYQRRNYVVEWMETDGQLRHIRCSYRADGELDDPKNSRGTLRGVEKWLPRSERPRPLQRRRPLFLLRWYRILLGEDQAPPSSGPVVPGTAHTPGRDPGPPAS